MVPSCLLQDPRQSERLALAVAGAEAARHVTLEEMLYPAPSWETEAAATPSRRSSPKVCPVNLADLFSDEEEEAAGPGSGGGYSPPGVVNESVSMSSFVSRASLQSLNSVSRRVSFRSPDESDVFIIPARSHSDDDDEEEEEWSSDGEPSRT